jgi:LysM repeat protein
VTVQLAPATAPRGRPLRYLAPAALAILAAAVIAVVVSVPGRSGQHSRPLSARHATLRELPPYWIVRPGDTFTQIAAKTGLTVAQLEAFNPQTDPMSLVSGERLNLWLHPPVPRPKPPGPMFWTVRPGESFGSIAAKTGINIIKLEELNPQLKPATLQPGERVRLRPS